MSGVSSGESCDKKESRLKVVSDRSNERSTESRAASVCNRLPAISASSDGQEVPGGRLLKDHVQTTIHERKRTPTLCMINAYYPVHNHGKRRDSVA